MNNNKQQNSENADGESRQVEQNVSGERWGCAYCNCKNEANADKCVNCKKAKKVGSPFHFSFEISR